MSTHNIWSRKHFSDEKSALSVAMKWFSYFSVKTYCGYSLEAPRWGASNEYPQHVFIEKYENYQYMYYLVEKKKAFYLKLQHQG